MGVEIVSLPSERVLEPSFAESFTELLREHLAVVVRDFPASPADQLRVTRMLGRVVAARRVRPGSPLTPELRHESDTAVNPYNAIWHSDTSWAEQPARYTLLYAMAIDGDCAATELLDTSEAYGRLPESRRAEIAPWKAWHHVELARSRTTRDADDSTTEASATTAGAAAASTTRPGPARRAVRRWRRLRHRDRGADDAVAPGTLDGASDVVELPKPDPPGAIHDVVRFDGPTRRTHLCLGEHAWTLDHLDGDAGASALAALRSEMEIEPTAHRWHRRDLLVFDNRVLLHRRSVVDGSAPATRELRRTMAWTG